MTLMLAPDAARSIRDDYLALPGLSLTRNQVRRLYSLDAVVCDGVLAALVDVRFLLRTGDGRYVRANSASSRGARPASRSGNGSSTPRHRAA